MKQSKVLPLTFLVTMMLGITGCEQGKTTLSTKTKMIFTENQLVLSNFEGLGVEWGTYEDRDKISNSAWERSLKIMDRLAPSVTRCMLNYDWFIENFDDKGDNDNSNDTWTYNFTNKYMTNTIEILRYCDDHNIDVAFGCWNVPGNVIEDQYHMMEKVTSDPRWAVMTVDIIEYLVRYQGIHCIKYFVNSNEPNYTGIQGSSKNYNNTFAIWSQGVKNVRAELDRRGFSNIGIIGGDTTGFEGSRTYLGGIAKDKELREAVKDYGFHLYAPNMYIDKGQLFPMIKELYDECKKDDEDLGVVRMPHIWESGLLDGKNNETDSNGYITSFSYGLRMTDYTIQCLMAGINSICYWDFDDAMHFMYQPDGSTNTKGWGMFSSLATDSAAKQEIRPWFHSTCLLNGLLQRGAKVYDSGVNDPEFDDSFRSMAVLGANDEYSGVVAVNRALTPVTKTFQINKELSEDQNKIYVYYYNDKDLKLGEDGYVIPNLQIDGALNREVTIEIPAGSVVVLSSKVL